MNKYACVGVVVIVCRVCWCDGEQVDRELFHDVRVGDRERDAGVRCLVDGYLLCVMDCFVVVVGLANTPWAGFCGPVPDDPMIGDSRFLCRSPVPVAVIPVPATMGVESCCINLTSNFYHRKKT